MHIFCNFIKKNIIFTQIERFFSHTESNNTFSFEFECLFFLFCRYTVLSPQACQELQLGDSRVDVANLLAKLDPAHSAHPNFMHNLMNLLAKMFGQKEVVPDLSVSFLMLHNSILCPNVSPCVWFTGCV